MGERRIQIDLQQDRHGDQEDLSRLHDNVCENQYQDQHQCRDRDGKTAREKRLRGPLLAVLLNEHNAGDRSSDCGLAIHARTEHQ